MGSFDFMAPEQGFGAPPDARMDLYSLGATYFYLLTGRPPYVVSNAAKMILLHRDAPVPDVREVRREITAAAASLISRLMAKDPAHRPAGADDVLRELDSYRILLDLDAGGSPFTLLPSPVEPTQGFDPPAVELVPAPALAPLPQPPAPRDPRWAQAAVAGVLVLIAVQGFGHAVKADWAAAGFFAAVITAFFFWSSRRGFLRASQRVLSSACMLAALYRYGMGAFVLPPAWPDLEVLATAALALAALMASLYLGLGQADRSAALGLLATAFAGFLATACGSWNAIFARLQSDGSLFISSWGPWRWACGILAVVLVRRILRRFTAGGRRRA